MEYVSFIAYLSKYLYGFYLIQINEFDVKIFGQLVNQSDHQACIFPASIWSGVNDDKLSSSPIVAEGAITTDVIRPLIITIRPGKGLARESIKE